MGTVIFLNGSSSSGKTAIARELQARWVTPLLLFGIDDVISMMPFKYTGDGCDAENGFSVRITSNPESFVPGDQGLRLNDLAGRVCSKSSTRRF